MGEILSISKQQYDQRFNISPRYDDNGNLVKSKHPFAYEPLNKYSNGQKVLYYIGPQAGINGKWHQMWTGPWIISRGDGNNHIIITNTKGKTCKVC